MKHALTFLCIGLMTSFIMVSCAGGKFQKRKYTKGFYREKTIRVNDELSNKQNEEFNNNQNKGVSTSKPEVPSESTVAEAAFKENTNSQLKETTYTTADRPVKESETKEGLNPIQPDYEQPWATKGSNPLNHFDKKRIGSSSQPESKTPINDQHNFRHGNFGVLGIILLVLLALILPPLAVAIYDGFSGLFWITLILWLLGIGIGVAFFIGSAFIALSGSLATILAILVVLGAFG